MDVIPTGGAWSDMGSSRHAPETGPAFAARGESAEVNSGILQDVQSEAQLEALTPGAVMSLHQATL